MMCYQRIPAFLALFMAAALAPAAAPAAPPALRIITIDGPPWGYLDQNGQATGMMYEIGNRIAEVAGLGFTNALVPYARTALDIEQGNADFVLRFGNEQMERWAHPVATIVTMPVIVVGQKGTNFRSLGDLYGRTVGVIRTSKYVDSFDANPAIKKYPVNDYVAMARMLSRGRLDAGVGSSAGLYYGAYMAGIKPEQLGPPLVLGHNTFVLFYSKKNATPEKLKNLKEAVAKLSASGEIRQIVNKYVDSYGFNMR